jgi:AraC-like DNA-binding protein
MNQIKESPFLDTILFENVQNSNGAFVKHFHDTYTIGITHSGMFKSINLNQSSYCYKSSTRIINPGDVHCGDSNDWKYTNFYPTVELVANIHEQIYGVKKIPLFTNHLIEDERLYSLLREFFIHYYNDREKIQIEIALIDVLSYLVLHYSNEVKPYETLFNDNKIIQSSIEFINDTLGEQNTLENLSQNVGLSKYHFIRIFKERVGLTPHQYIVTKRVQRAKELIASGSKLSNVAIEVGFNDQSHFIRNFKKIYGYLPKEIIKNSSYINGYIL